MFRRVGALNFPKSSARWMISYPGIGRWIRQRAGKIVQPGVGELESRFSADLSPFEIDAAP
jgi:hypothetical protein